MKPHWIEFRCDAFRRGIKDYPCIVDEEGSVLVWDEECDCFSRSHWLNLGQTDLLRDALATVARNYVVVEACLQSDIGVT